MSLGDDETALSDPIVLKDKEALKFLRDLEHPVYSEKRAMMLKKAAETAELFAEK
jgi:hypothetical protein